jgi:hypothetical protein
MVAPYSAAPPGAEAARAMMARSVPMDLVQTAATSTPGTSSNILLAGGPMPGMGAISPAGVPFQPIIPGMSPPPAAVAAAGAVTGAQPNPHAAKRTELEFVAPRGMRVSWFAPTPDGRAGFATNYLNVPGRYNFLQAAIYRLKLSNIPNQPPDFELYPTLEVVPGNARTETFLAHSAVPVAFTEEDFEQVRAHNFLVKVIYLPDPQFQELATAGTEEVVSSRLEPGVDPIAEAHRRGSILLVVRMGNINLEAPNTPPMDAPSPYMPKHAMATGMPGPAMPQGVTGMGRPPIGGVNSSVLPPAMPNSNSQQPPPASGPVSKLPDAPVIQQAQYKVSTGGKPAPPADSTAKVDKKSKPGSWWWPWNGSDK